MDYLKDAVAITPPPFRMPRMQGYMPKNRARMCLEADCQVIFDSYDRCPACGSGALMHVANWLDRLR